MSSLPARPPGCGEDTPQPLYRSGDPERAEQPPCLRDDRNQVYSRQSETGGDEPKGRARYLSERPVSAPATADGSSQAGLAQPFSRPTGRYLRGTRASPCSLRPVSPVRGFVCPGAAWPGEKKGQRMRPRPLVSALGPRAYDARPDVPTGFAESRGRAIPRPGLVHPGRRAEQPRRMGLGQASGSRSARLGVGRRRSQ